MVSLAHRQLAHQPQTASSGSHTVAPTSAASQSTTEIHQQSPAAILRLRGAHGRNDRNVQWAEGVVDNEGMNRKRSKVCCIYHRPRAVDESSDESSSSDSDSSSDSSDSDGCRTARGDADRARPSRVGNNNSSRRHRHAPDCPEHGHSHDESHGHDHDRESSSDEGGAGGSSDRRSRGNKGKGKAKRKPSPNAYEKIPRYDKPAKK